MERSVSKQISFDVAFSGVDEGRVRKLMETHTWNVTLPAPGTQTGSAGVDLRVDADSLIEEGYTREEIAAAAAVITGAVIFVK